MSNQDDSGVKKRAGRPQLYPEKLVSRNHWMTPHGHQYIRAHKREIEELAQKWESDEND